MGTHLKRHTKTLHVHISLPELLLDLLCNEATATLVILKGDGQMLAGDAGNGLQGNLSGARSVPGPCCKFTHSTPTSGPIGPSLVHVQVALALS